METIELGLMTGALAGAGAGGVLVGAVMRRPLFSVLLEICGTENGARFWVVFSRAVLILVPLFAVSVLLPDADYDPFFTLKVVVASLTGGLLLSVLAIGGPAE